MVARSAFASLIFDGKRFPAGSMPVEALPELTAYKDLLVAVARELFFQDNTSRLRLPKGFDESFRLSISKIESGSAVPVLEREAPQVANLFPDYFERARDEVEQLIAGVPGNGPWPSWGSPNVVGRFNAFGRTLKDDEFVIVAKPGRREGARYDRQVRRRILLTQGTYEEDVDLVGVVRETDADQDSFELRLADDRRIPVRSSRPFFPQVVRSLGSDSAVRVSGVGVFDAEGTLLRVAQAAGVSAAEEGDVASGRPGCRIPIAEQVDSLKALQDGWLDGEGRAFTDADLAWSSKLLASLVTGFDLTTPYIYPTLEGRVRAEWSRPRWEISLELDAAQRVSEVMAVRLDADELRERTFPLAEPGQEVLLGSFVANQLRPEE